MSTKNISAILNTLQSQLERSEFEAANQTFTELSEAYTARQLDEKLLVGKAQARRNTGSIPEPLRDQLYALEEQYLTTELSRMSVLGSVSLFLLNPTAAPASSVTSNLSTAVSREDDLQQEIETTSPELQGLVVPPTLKLVTTDVSNPAVFVGDSTSVSITVQNVGSSSAADVTAQSESNDLTVDPSTQSVGVIDSESSESITMSASSDSPGTHKLEFEVSSSNAGNVSGNIEVSFTTPVEVLDFQRDELVALEGDVSDASPPGGAERGLIDKLAAAQDSISRAISGLESSSRGGQPPTRALNTAINQLGAYLNQVDALSKHLSPAYESRLRTGGESGIGELSRVRDYIS
ncbi:CARDB domain-containing protein [Haloferax sp. YSSS75]|uniref:CARDB domain-containing protein n=1 Tax=Haloferax sp. YSSS75 TaxID=3388564 RepID=UPI00398CEEE4